MGESQAETEAEREKQRKIKDNGERRKADQVENEKERGSCREKIGILLSTRPIKCLEFGYGGRDVLFTFFSLPIPFRFF